MNKKFILPVGILFLLAAAGCDLDSGRDRPITGIDIKKGFQGVVMEFAEKAPPERAYEESIFPIGIILKNKGATDIEKGVIVLGLEKNYVDIAEGFSPEQEFNIKGKSVFNPVGDEEFIKMSAQAKKIGTQSETHTSTILATACYSYNTTFESSVCVDTDIYGMRKGEKACTIGDLIFGEGQGAPVAITQVETRMLPDADQNKIKPHFIIHIENKGNGEVISPEKVEEDGNEDEDSGVYIYEKACTSSSLKYDDFNTLRISATLSDKKLNCKVGSDDSTSTVIRLRDKKDMVRCTLEEGIEREDTERNLDSYTTPLKVVLEYGYTFTISKDIIIEKVLKY